MKTDDANPWVHGEDSVQVDQYLGMADLVVVERRLILKILSDLFAYHFEKPQGLTLFDLGCGDGVLSRHINSRYPGNQFRLMDGSQEMITRAKEQFRGDHVSFTCQTFEDYIMHQLASGATTLSTRQMQSTTWIWRERRGCTPRCTKRCAKVGCLSTSILCCQLLQELRLCSSGCGLTG